MEISDGNYEIYAHKNICGCFTIKICQLDSPDIEVTYEKLKELVDYITQQRLSGSAETASPKFPSLEETQKAVKKEYNGTQLLMELVYDTIKKLGNFA